MDKIKFQGHAVSDTAGVILRKGNFGSYICESNYIY